MTTLSLVPTWAMVIAQLTNDVPRRAEDFEGERARPLKQSPTAETRREAAAGATVEVADGRPLAMRWGVPVICSDAAPTRASPQGEYRAQCDDEARTCLVSPLVELDADGEPTAAQLARVQPCDTSAGTLRTAAANGYRIVLAIAESPPGWVRDARGRVMQFNFDLNRRVYLGAVYAPNWSAPGGFDHRLRADFGIRAEAPSGEGHILHRVNALVGELSFGQAFVADAVLARYDISTVWDAPLVRVTTFIGEPQRHDLYLNIGLWTEALHLEVVRENALTASFLTLGSAQVTADLWHSKDMTSYVRVRGGAGGELDTVREFVSLKPEAAVEGDLTLDRDGFHHVTFGLEGEKLFLDPEVTGRALHPVRLRARAGYELILIAINDYPLTLLVQGRGTWRDDLPGVPPGTDWSAIAGLRFSFWAPARLGAPVSPRG